MFKSIMVELRKKLPNQAVVILFMFHFYFMFSHYFY